MSGLVFACIAPHGSMIIPLLAGEEGQKTLATRAAMEELGRYRAELLLDFYSLPGYT